MKLIVLYALWWSDNARRNTQREQNLDRDEAAEKKGMVKSE